jgi:NADH-quinone oxidoreductase subunit N
MEGFDPSIFIGNLTWLRPEMLLVIVGFVVLAMAVTLPIERRHWSAAVALVGVVAAAVLVVSYLPGVPFGSPKVASGGEAGGLHDGEGRPAFVADGFSVVFKIIFLIGAALCILMSVRYLDWEDAQAGEFYAIVLFAVVGMMFLASGSDFATIYIGLETMALASYVLVGFSKGRRKTNEAALKYFILGTLASGILLYGFSLVYGTTGSFHLDGIAASIAAGTARPTPLLHVGAVLVLVGMAFKIAAVPFHMWAPDAYEGAPTPVTAFISTAAKAGAFAMLLRVFLRGFYGLADDWTPLLVVLSIASMTLGNVVAIAQDNVKRMLAYSSIAHVGYALMGLIAVGAAGGDAVTERYGMTSVVLYLLIYTFTNMGACFCCRWRASRVRPASSGSGGCSVPPSRRISCGWP